MTRASPVGLGPSDADRADLYRAALEQFEELIRAAELSGPASRPLPLFYALAQAGRAIAAVRGGSDHHGHGLRLGQPQPDALQTEVIPNAKTPGQFQGVAAVVGSPSLAGPATIGALLASLPEMADTLLLHDDWPTALAVFEREPPMKVATPGWTPITVRVDKEPITFPELLQALQSYPSTIGKLGVPKAVQELPSLPLFETPEGYGVGVMFKGETADFELAAPQYRIYGRRWFRPAIANGDPPDPLLTWWALLYALSMYARYHPREWVAALDIDSSPVGVTLERVMDRALDALPHVVLSAVLTTPFLLPATEGLSLDPFGRGRLGA